MRSRMVASLLFAWLIALLAAGCGETEVAERFNEGFENGKQAAQGAASSQQRASSVQKFKVGEKAKIGDAIVVVHAVNDPQRPKGSFLKPGEGNKWVSVDVEVKNSGSEPRAISSLLQFNLQDAENHRYGTTLSDVTPPPPNGEIAPGEAVRGLVVFEMLKDAKKPYQFIYDASVWGFGQVIVEIP